MYIGTYVNKYIFKLSYALLLQSNSPKHKRALARGAQRLRIAFKAACNLYDDKHDGGQWLGVRIHRRSGRRPTRIIVYYCKGKYNTV